MRLSGRRNSDPLESDGEPVIKSEETRSRFELEYGRLTWNQGNVQQRSMSNDFAASKFDEFGDQGLYIPTRKLIPKADMTSRRGTVETVLATTCGMNLSCAQDNTIATAEEQSSRPQSEHFDTAEEEHFESAPSPRHEPLYFACN